MIVRTVVGMKTSVNWATLALEIGAVNKVMLRLRFFRGRKGEKDKDR